MKRGPTTAKEAWQGRIIDSIMAEVRRRKAGRYCVLSDVVRMCNAILADRLYRWKLTEKPSNVLSDDALDGCEMARAMTERCSRMQVSGCAWCKTFASRQCEARAFLAKHGQADAWEVKR